MRVCKQCGVPYPIAHFHIWTNDGRLLARDNNQRLVIVERTLMARIFESLGEELGGRTYQVLREAKAYGAKNYVKNLMGRRIIIMRRFLATRRMVLDKLVEFLKVLGLARLEVLEYNDDGTARFRCYHAYQRDFFLGDLLGGYLVLEGKPFEASIEEGDGFFDILIKPRSDLPDPTLGFSYEPEEPAIGYLGYKTCKRCGTPLPVSFFHWDLKEGTVRDTRSGEYVVFIDTVGINMAIEKMKDDYREVDGEDLEHLLARNTKTVVDSLIPLMDWKHRRPEEQVRDLFFLAFRGMGNPIFTEPVEGGVKVRVENPHSYPIVAGIVASFIAKDRPSDFTWSRVAESRLEVIIRYR